MGEVVHTFDPGEHLSACDSPRLVDENPIADDGGISETRDDNQITVGCSVFSCLWPKCLTINLNEGAKSNSGFYSSNYFH